MILDFPDPAGSKVNKTSLRQGLDRQHNYRAVKHVDRHIS